MIRAGRILYIALVVVIAVISIGGIIVYTQGIESLVSFEAGFIGFIFIVSSSFFALLKQVKNNVAIENPQEGNLNQKQQRQSKGVQFSERLMLGAQVSLSFLRLLSYVFFAAVLIVLFKYSLMSILWFFIGLCVAIIVLVWIGWCNIRHNKSSLQTKK